MSSFRLPAELAVAATESDPRRRSELLIRGAEQLARQLATGTERIEAGFLSLQAELSQINESFAAISEAMTELRTLHHIGIALQMEVLRRDNVQARLEEFVFRFRKLVREIEAGPKPEADEVVQYHLLAGVLQRIDAEGIATTIIRGIENKTLFDETLSTAQRLHGQLASHPKVVGVLDWVAGERERERLDRERAEAKAEEKSAERDRELRDEEERLRKARNKIKKSPPPLPAAPTISFGVWLKRRRISVVALVLIGMGIGFVFFVMGFAGFTAFKDTVIGPMAACSACVLPFAAIPLPFAFLYHRYRGSNQREDAEVWRALDLLFDHFDILTVDVGNLDSPEREKLVRIAEIIRYGDTHGAITTGMVRFLRELIAKQPWAIRNSDELKKRRVDTERRVGRELGQIALQLGVVVPFEPNLLERVS